MNGTKYPGMRFLVTGSSGFIGTNLCDHLSRVGAEWQGLDIAPPQQESHRARWRQVDILDYPALARTVAAFAPTHVVHLAARTDLHEKRHLEGYQSNIAGVANLAEALEATTSVRRCLYASSRLVCSLNHEPRHDEDYCPDTLYGESKVLGEQRIRRAKGMRHEWIIARPTSIWGPWSLAPHLPYGRFFKAIRAGHYVHLGPMDAPRLFGFVGNVNHQMLALLQADARTVSRGTYYLSDYETTTIRDWANRIADAMGRRRPMTIPGRLAMIAAQIGDLAKLAGYLEPPLTTQRLRNMQAATDNVPLDTMRAVAPQLPFSLERGIAETIAWLEGR